MAEAAAKRAELAAPGDICVPDVSRGVQRPEHEIIDPVDDAELQAVAAWLQANELEARARVAIDDAIRYVLESERTRRFTLTDPDVDSDERASVGTKLQYRIIEQLGLVKEPPLDTTILGLPVEIKTTVRENWMIPREGQCEITLLIRIDAAKHEFEITLMRPHRAWLNRGNQDSKRTIAKAAHTQFAQVLVPPSPLPEEPLRLLTPEEVELVLGKGGMRRRLIHLFSILPETVVPRASITTVGAGLKDPLRRAREAKQELRKQGLVLLVGTWPEERDLAAAMDFDISGEAWVAVHEETFAEAGLAIPSMR